MNTPITPTVKDPGIEAVITAIAGGSRVEAILGCTCNYCKKAADKFRDEISKKEFSISGLCQTCQDEVFGGIED